MNKQFLLIHKNKILYDILYELKSILGFKIKFLSNNNFSNEDCITIIRTLLNKSKRVLKLSYDYKNNNNMDLTISSAKPPIFWKEKEIVKQQIFKWKPDNIKKLIFKINDIELLIKKNLNNSVNLVTDFLIEQSSPKANN